MVGISLGFYSAKGCAKAKGKAIGSAICSNAVCGAQGSRHVGQVFFSWSHVFRLGVSNTWKQLVTEAVMGLMSSMEMGQDSLFLQASSATNQAMRRGMGFGFAFVLGTAAAEATAAAAGGGSTQRC